jgi:hypothetical protein
LIAHPSITIIAGKRPGAVLAVTGGMQMHTSKYLSSAAKKRKGKKKKKNNE